MKNSGLAISIIVLLVILNLTFGILAVLKRNGLRSCEKTENPYCPTYYCATLDATCGHKAFRSVGSSKECQSYLLNESSTAKVTNL